MEFHGHNIATWYFAIINIVTMASYDRDKPCAWDDAHRYRSHLRQYWGVAAMRLFRHKTLHLKFKYGLPCILILQLAALMYLHLPK